MTQVASRLDASPSRLGFSASVGGAGEVMSLAAKPQRQRELCFEASR